VDSDRIKRRLQFTDDHPETLKRGFAAFLPEDVRGLVAEVERLTAMNVRLRDALERIESIDVVETEDAYSMGAIARRALAEAVRG
jgi:hypothetical protein